LGNRFDTYVENDKLINKIHAFEHIYILFKGGNGDLLTVINSGDVIFQSDFVALKRAVVFLK